MNIQTLQTYIIQYGVQFISSLVIVIVGFWLIGKIVRMSKNILSQKKVDKGLAGFLQSLVAIGLKALVVLVALGQLGIETTSFVALLGAAGLAIGLALQGSLANFAGGALILFFKPFRVGDLIEVQGHTGTVTDIQIFVTTLVTPENKTIIIPNGELSNGTIVNISEQGKLRIDLLVGVSYDADIKKAKEIALQVLENHPLVLDDPQPTVQVLDLADSSVNLGIRPWVSVENYWIVYSEILEHIKYAYDEQGIGIPYPHQVVHMYNQKNDA